MRTSKLPDGRVVVCAQDVDADKLVGMTMFAAEGQEQYDPVWTGLNQHGEPLQIEEGVICSTYERYDRGVEGPDIDISYMTTLSLRANAMFCWVLQSELNNEVRLAKRSNSGQRDFADGWESAISMMTRLVNDGQSGQELIDAMRMRGTILRASQDG